MSLRWAWKAVKKKIKVSELQIVEGRLNRKYDSLRNFYEMKLREHREVGPDACQ